MTDRWLDLSRYQGAPNFDLIKVSGMVQGTIAQAGGYGSLADPQFVRNHSEAKRVGMVAGAYYFADPSQTSPGQQVDHFLSLAPSADFYAVDYEIGAGDLTAWADTFQALLASKTGKLPWAYTGSWFWTAHYHGHNLINYPLWLASYTAVEPAPPPPWTWITAWQYTSSFACPGIAGGVDASWVYAAPPQGEDLTPEQAAMLQRIDLALPAIAAAVQWTINDPDSGLVKVKAELLRIDAATQWAINDPDSGLVKTAAKLDALKAQVATITAGTQGPTGPAGPPGPAVTSVTIAGTYPVK